MLGDSDGQFPRGGTNADEDHNSLNSLHRFPSRVNLNAGVSCLRIANKRCRTRFMHGAQTREKEVMYQKLAAYCFVALLVAVASVSQTFAGQVFFIGEDNGNLDEMCHESYADDNYYWENGDYTALGGLNWTSGMEPWEDDTSAAPDPAIGIERAWTSGDPIINVFFQLDASEADPASEFTFEIDVYGSDGGKATDFEFSMNGNVFYTGTGITPGTNGTVACSITT